MLTLNQIKNSTAANVAGVNVNDPQFTAYVNDAVQILIDLAGDSAWWGQVVSMNGVVSGGCITWPHKIDAVLAMNIDHHAVRLANHWYSFTPDMGTFAGLVSSPDFYSHWGCGSRRESVIEFAGTQPMFSGPTLANPFAIQVTADNSDDYGKSVTIYGLDTNGQEVFSNQFDGTQNATVSQRGIKMTLAAIAPATASVFSTVTEVTKDITVGCVRAWAYANSKPGNMCAIWGGAQTSPQFLFSRLANAPHNGICHANALVKLGFEPVAQDSDIISISNREAIKSMIQSIKAREAGDDAKGDEYEKTAIRRLNMEMETRFPVDQMQIRNNTFGTAVPNRRRLF
jgi:hypothetical protein